ncbi:hypothetical protein GTQ43_10750 [Nostoc sp. KVJ3]|uniref:hypothetical protein n=1 Tax=Nostoc sp. KVJ3 TaxID=457945 RepID=UPI0022378296|nr:hypothetical protein [Nostoc sp. KVJ3]MCW5314265.1 hypothetical protein [Nostoc sp. KVJ3]
MRTVVFALTLNPSPILGYGVHTSLKIPPSTWFRHLAIGLCDRSVSLGAARRNDEAIAKTHGIV